MSHTCTLGLAVSNDSLTEEDSHERGKEMMAAALQVCMLIINS